VGTWTKDPGLWSWTGSHGPKTGTKVSKESGQKIGFVLVFVSFIHCIDVQKIFICKHFLYGGCVNGKAKTGRVTHHDTFTYYGPWIGQTIRTRCMLKLIQMYNSDNRSR